MWCMKILQDFLNLLVLGTCSLPGNKPLILLEKRDFFSLRNFLKCEFYSVGETSHWFHYTLHVAREEAWDRKEMGECRHPRTSRKSDLGMLLGDVIWPLQKFSSFAQLLYLVYSGQCSLVFYLWLQVAKNQPQKFMCLVRYKPLLCVLP